MSTLPTLSVVAPALAGKIIVFTIFRNGDLSGPTIVDWTTSVGYNGTSWFGGGESSKSVWVDAPSEQASIELVNPRGATILVGRAAYGVTTPTPVPPASDGIVFDLTRRPTFWSPSTCTGQFKTNMWWGSDGSIWQDTDSSRAGSQDKQIYSDQTYNGVDPFSFGPNGITISTKSKGSGWTSGSISTETSFRQTFGRFDFLGVRLNDLASGLWPAIWLLNEQGQEIDVIEVLGSDPGLLYFNAHLPIANRSVPEGTYRVNPNVPHDISLVWSRDKIAWYVDNVLAYQADNIGICKALYPIISMAVGPKTGGWADINPAGPSTQGTFTVREIRIK